MAFLAVENLAVAYLRGSIPEFEPAFRELLEDEGYWELGALQVFSELARWVFEHPEAEVAARTFAAVEFILTEKSVREGHDEVIDFFETFAQEGRRRPDRAQELRPLWGESMRRWMTDYGGLP